MSVTQTRELLDTRRKIETPEGVELMLRLAGPLPRAAAWLIDLLIKTAIIMFFVQMFAFLGAFGEGLLLLLMFAVMWAYAVLFEVLRHGATPGKQAMKIRVVSDNGTPVGWSASIVRNLVRFVDYLPMTYLVGLIAVLLNKDFKRLGDMAAGTVVIHDERRSAKPLLEPEIAAKAPSIVLDADEQRAILAFGDRHGDLNPERADELAAIVAGYLTTDEKGATDQLLANARWLTGHS